MKKLILLFTLLITSLISHEEAKACISPPPQPPSVIIQRYSDTTACIIICNYRSFGADTANFCACALNSVTPILSVNSLEVTDSNRVPLPGFPFVFNPNTGPSFNNFQPGNWKGFLSDISQTIPPFISVKIIIMVTIPPNDSTSSSPIDQLQLLASNLASATNILGSDEAAPDGTILNHHLAFRPAGVITIIDTLTSITPIGGSLAEGYKLSQNYPNPFNPVTNITFSLQRSGYAEIKIFDLAGKEVHTMVNTELPAGNFSVAWDASDVPSGAYFYRLTAGDVQIVKKMILLK